MKKLFLTLAIAAVASSSVFAQEKLVKQVEREAKKDKADYKMVRQQLAPALVNPESANMARTWYVAGLIDEKEAEKYFIMQTLGQQLDAQGQKTFYTAIYNMVGNYFKADSLDALPNAKGKVKRKYDKKIREGLEKYYPYLINAGATKMDAKDFEGSHKYFDKYMEVRRSPIFEGTDHANMDSTAMQIGFFNAYTASQIEGNLKNAIAEYEKIKTVPYRQNDVYQLLVSSYAQEKDTVNMLKTLEEGKKLFPQEPFYLHNLINIYITKGENEQAKKYLDNAISEDPKNKQLYYVMATLYEQGFKDAQKAQSYYEKALEIDPQYKEAFIGLGRIYYNQAAQIQSDANAITDQVKYKAELDKAKELFKKALPYFEKVVELDPENSEYLIALRGIYYNLGMDAKYNEIEKKLNK